MEETRLGWRLPGAGEYPELSVRTRGLPLQVLAICYKLCASEQTHRHYLSSRNQKAKHKFVGRATFFLKASGTQEPFPQLTGCSSVLLYGPSSNNVRLTYASV